MSDTMKNIIGMIVIVGIAYFAFTYTTPFTESEVFAESKALIAKDDRFIGAKFINKGLYGSYMIHVDIELKDGSEVEYFCGYSDGMIWCSGSPEKLNDVVAKTHGELEKISRD